MLNDFFLLQLVALISLFFFINSINIITMWYVAGFYLITLGLLLLLDDMDIFVGFLWVIDLGVGLIFFIFILHFSNFLYQKSIIEINNRFFFFFFFFSMFTLFFFFFFQNSEGSNLNYQLKKNWFFFITWYNYYSTFNTFNVTELALLREIYFYNNSFEFFLINFIILYGILGSVLLCFLLKRFFSFLNKSELLNFKILTKSNSIFFIRNQNFIKQQNASMGTRVWMKKKFSKFYDF